MVSSIPAHSYSLPRSTVASVRFKADSNQDSADLKENKLQNQNVKIIARLFDDINKVLTVDEKLFHALAEWRVQTMSNEAVEKYRLAAYIELVKPLINNAVKYLSPLSSKDISQPLMALRTFVPQGKSFTDIQKPIQEMIKALSPCVEQAVSYEKDYIKAALNKLGDALRLSADEIQERMYLEIGDEIYRALNADGLIEETPPPRGWKVLWGLLGKRQATIRLTTEAKTILSFRNLELSKFLTE